MGVGLTIGPFMGSGLYELFGFNFTFILIGCFLFWFAFVVNFWVPRGKHDIEMDSIPIEQLEKLNSSSRDEEIVVDSNQEKAENKIHIDHEMALKHSNEKKCGYMDGFSDKIIFLSMLVAFYSYFVYWFQEPILALRLEKDYQMSDFEIGLFFMISAVSYIVSWIAVPILFKNRNDVTMMYFGTLFWGFSLLLVGPTKLIPDNLITMAIGQFLYVFFSVIMLLYPLPEMINILWAKFPNQKVRATDIWSSILNFGYGSGQLLGPIFGSLFTYLFDFRICWDIVAAQCVVLSVLFFIVSSTSSKKHVEK